MDFCAPFMSARTGATPWSGWVMSERESFCATFCGSVVRTGASAGVPFRVERKKGYKNTKKNSQNYFRLLLFCFFKKRIGLHVRPLYPTNTQLSIDIP